MSLKVSKITQENLAYGFHHHNYSPFFSKRKKEDFSPINNLAKNKILLVEDELVFQCLHRAALKKMGYNIDLAGNGAQAIEHFQCNAYDLVLLDIGLPDMSGIEVGQFIRSHIDGKHIPILALTGYGKQVEPQCLEAGFNEVLEKPIKLDRLEFILKETLSPKPH